MRKALVRKDSLGGRTQDNRIVGQQFSTIPKKQADAGQIISRDVHEIPEYKIHGLCINYTQYYQTIMLLFNLLSPTEQIHQRLATFPT